MLLITVSPTTKPVGSRFPSHALRNVGFWHYDLQLSAVQPSVNASGFEMKTTPMIPVTALKNSETCHASPRKTRAKAAAKMGAVCDTICESASGRSEIARKPNATPP